MKKQFEDRKLVALYKLHTFSSLNEEFLNQYKGSIDEPDTAIVYFNPESITHKRLKPITKESLFIFWKKRFISVYRF